MITSCARPGGKRGPLWFAAIIVPHSTASCQVGDRSKADFLEAGGAALCDRAPEWFYPTITFTVSYLPFAVFTPMTHLPFFRA